MRIVYFLRELSGIRRRPFGLYCRVDRCRDRIFCDEISVDEFNFPCDAPFDGLSPPPRGLDTVGGC